MFRMTSAEWTPGALQAGRQRPILKWRSVAQRAGLPGEHRHVMPGIIDRLAAAETAAMLADNRALLAYHDAVGIGLDLDRPTDSARGDRVLVVVEPHQTGLRHRGLNRMEAVEWASWRHQLAALGFEGLPDRAVGQLGMLVRLGVGDASVEQPGIQLVVACHPQPRREETLTHQTDLVFDLALLPA